MLVGSRNLLNIPPGINKDNNSFTSLVYTDAQQMRFYNGLPEMIGGWNNASFGNEEQLTGVPRTIFSYLDNAGIKHTLIGTNTALYVYQSNNIFNITPLETTTTSIPNSLSTNYQIIGTNPIATTINTRTLTLTYSPMVQGIFQIGDVIKISGAVADIGGIPLAEINLTHVVTAVTATTIDVVVTSTATSTATGGGAAVLISTRVLNVAQLAHGYSFGNRIGITGAASMGGFMDTDINKEVIIRNISTNAYSIYLSQTTDFATSSVTADGGAATEVQGQIAAGNCTFSAGLGYGGGPYSAGSYGTAKTFTNGYTLPRIWSIDRYGDGVLLTPGDGSNLYEWGGDENVAPTIVSGAPTAINFVFVANNQAVTFGAGGIQNRIKTSDSNDITNWTIDATSNAYQGDILGTGRLIAHSYIKDQHLLFTETSVYTMQFIGLPEIWLIKELTTADGIIGPNAVIQANDAVMWCGHKDFYIYNGSVFSQIPDNNLKHWFFDNINQGKYYLTFARKVVQFNEFWIFAPFGGDAEPGTYVIWNYQEGHWTNGNLTRTAAEDSQNALAYQWLTNGSCSGNIPTTMYRHEVGFSANGSNLVGSLTSNYTQISEGDIMQQITRIVPSTQLLPVGSASTGQTLYTITVNGKEYDGSTLIRVFGPYNTTINTEKIETRISGRQRQYVFNFDSQQGFRIQKMFEELKPSTFR